LLSTKKEKSECKGVFLVPVENLHSVTSTVFVLEASEKLLRIQLLFKSLFENVQPGKNCRKGFGVIKKFRKSLDK